MSEKLETIISPEITPQPNTLDVIKINGRWAQAKSSGSLTGSIKYLDDGSMELITWNEYDYQSSENIDVGDLMDKKEIGEKEFMNVHWGSEQDKKPSLRRHVTVFGEYHKK